MPRSRQTVRWMSRPIEFLKSLRSEFGDTFTIHLLNERPWVMVSDPQLVKEVFAAPTDVLHAGASKQIIGPIVGPTSVLTEEEGRHMRRRKMLLPLFHTERVSRHEAAMREIARSEIDRWPRGESAPAKPRMSAIALEVIVRAVFGDSAEERISDVRSELGELVWYISSNGRTSLVAFGDAGRLNEHRFDDLRERIRRVEELVLAEIIRRREIGRADGADILSLLIDAKYDDGTAVTDGEVRDQLMTLMVAGHDTTATSLAWGLERIARNPEATERLALEAPSGGGPYTEAAVREILRLRPVFVVVPRYVMKPFRLGDMLIPEGIAVTPAIPLVHLRPEIYPEPDAFRPERFLERTPGTYTWIPFGGGPRRCIGAGFAVLQMRAVLSTLFERNVVEPVTDQEERATRQGLLIAPSDGANVILRRR